ncbi:UbiA family prenyltransferase [Variovorax saccharolyticus]|uniref:UbiA family prenyltransferase n=1 Tax=Variovorax saccharolyticus TaxID=3053516 RepID=UPI0025782D5E|nr:UbiA family prenyltransferase [Variovorax sp. J31P216]MDM0026852.1 UbiA family prenyltransferase [Variovorax sp. J31P216]
MASSSTLYVDLDGSLIATDLLHESLLSLVRVEPLAFLHLPRWLMQGKAALKRELASRAEIDVTTLPYRPEVLKFVQDARADGRRVVLATASDSGLALKVAEHLDIFDGVLASDGEHNLGGARKLEAMQVDAAGKDFSYLGDRPVDLAVWRGAESAVVVSRSDGLARRAASVTRLDAHIKPAAVSLKRYLYALRVHQWLKNVLVFLPLMPVLHALDWRVVFHAGVAFFAFGLMASSIYVLNDLLDLSSDRRHKRKRFRPFASGEISVPTGLWMCAGLCSASLLLSLLLLPPMFMGVLLIYLVLTTTYSFYLKRRAIVDVFSLAGLYTVRVAAGAAATGLPLSFWILSFSLFIFLSLALAKRYVELSGTPAEVYQMTQDRNYHPVDLPLVLCAGVAAGQMSALVLSLYLNDQQMLARYSNPALLWILIPVFLFWIMRIWLKAVRGALHDDPVVFAARDWVSRLALVIGAAALWAAG